MSVSGVLLEDGVQFARSIRSLSRRVHHVLREPATDQEIQDLFDEIDRLEGEANARRTVELGRWLVSLRRFLEEQVLATI